MRNSAGHLAEGAQAFLLNDDLLSLAQFFVGLLEALGQANLDPAIHAIALAGKAALHSGAGLVTLAVPTTILETVAGHDPCYMTWPLPADELGRITADAEEPEGLPVGTEAPAIELPALDGEPLSPAVLRGRGALLLFWNPDCGYCRAMHADLLAWETGHDDHRRHWHNGCWHRFARRR